MFKITLSFSLFQELEKFFPFQLDSEIAVSFLELKDAKTKMYGVGVHLGLLTNGLIYLVCFATVVHTHIILMLMPIQFSLYKHSSL